MSSNHVKYDYKSKIFISHSLTHPLCKWILKVCSVHFLEPSNQGGNDLLPPFRRQFFSLSMLRKKIFPKKAYSLKKSNSAKEFILLV